MDNIRKELRQYIETVILPQYDLNENAHGRDHIKYVTERSLKFAKEVEDINCEMVYVIAAYHDIGHHIDAKHHEIVSADIFMKDENMKRFFTDNERKIIKQAIEDHRASSNHEPHTVYGRIVSSADRNTIVDSAIKRSITYQRTHKPELTEEEGIEEARKHLVSKFGKDGYAVDKIYFGKEEYIKYLHDLQELTRDKEKFVEKSHKLMQE